MGMVEQVKRKLRITMGKSTNDCFILQITLCAFNHTHNSRQLVKGQEAFLV